MKTSIIISTYNRPETLYLVIKSLLNQTVAPSEIIIADDGSTQETAFLIEEMRNITDILIIHAWQKDEGFRLAKARNLAVSKSLFKEFLIFIDGDCVPLSNFVERYITLAEEGWFCTGSRILFSEKLTASVLENKTEIYKWGKKDWLFHRVTGGINRLLPLIHLGNGKWRYKHSERWDKLRGCNMGFYYSDMLKINGFDESYTDWGREDTDIAIRFINAGVKRKDARFSAPVMHMWHQEHDKSNLHKNTQMVDDVIKEKRSYALKGLDQYL